MDSEIVKDFFKQNTEWLHLYAPIILTESSSYG